MHSINVYNFDLLDGVVPVFRRTARMLERDGVGTFGRRRLGDQSPDFELRSSVYVADMAACRLRFKLYEALIAQSPGPPDVHQYVLVQDGYNYETAEELHVVVLDVRPVIESRRSSVRTGFTMQNPGATFLCQAIWRLRFRPATEYFLP